MKSILSSIIIALLSGSALAAIGLEIVDPVEGHPNQCFVKERNTFYDVNESWNLKECGVGSCSSMNIRGKQQFIVSYNGCGVVHAEAPCYVSQNKALTYPDCCPEIVCPEFEETEQNGNGISEDQDDQNNNLASSEFGQTDSIVNEDDLYGYKNPSGFRFY